MDQICLDKGHCAVRVLLTLKYIIHYIRNKKKPILCNIFYKTEAILMKFGT